MNLCKNKNQKAILFTGNAVKETTNSFGSAQEFILQLTKNQFSR